MRHPVIPSVAVCAAAVVLLAGCGAGDSGEAPGRAVKSEASAASGAGGSFDVAAALKDAGTARYSAGIEAKTYTGSTLTIIMTGRMNLNGPAPTGKLTMKTSDSVPEAQALHAETILLEDATYTRMLDGDAGAGAGTGTGTGAGEWQRVGLDSPGAGLADYGAYARLLLDLGPKARKGAEEVDGVPAYRLSGDLTQDRVKTVDPRLYDRMRATGTEEFACDLWVDASGRVVRFEQWLEMSGSSAHNVVTFEDFGAPVPVNAPE